MRICLTLCILFVCLADQAQAQGITDPNQLSGNYDRFNTGAWTNNFGTWRDNNPANGDTWLATNTGHVFNDHGISWIGMYVGASGDFNSWSYSFIAGEAINFQDWTVLFTVNRVSGNRARNVRFQVDVNGSGFTTVDTSSIFGDDDAPRAVYTLSTTSGFGQSGPFEQRTADVSSAGISAGDSVTYRFLMAQNSPIGRNSRNIGLAVALGAVPEPRFALHAGWVCLLIAALRRRAR